MSTAAKQPSLNGANGRAAKGRFAKGWKGGPGNPHAKRVNQLRSVFLDVATPDRMRKVVNAIFTAAEAGDMTAAREVMDRVYGKATQPIEVTGADGGPVVTKTAIDYDQLAADLEAFAAKRATGDRVPADRN